MSERSPSRARPVLRDSIGEYLAWLNLAPQRVASRKPWTRGGPLPDDEEDPWGATIRPPAAAYRVGRAFTRLAPESSVLTVLRTCADWASIGGDRLRLTAWSEAWIVLGSIADVAVRATPEPDGAVTLPLASLPLRFEGPDAHEAWRVIRDGMEELEQPLADARDEARVGARRSPRRSGPARDPGSHDGQVLKLLVRKAGAWVSYDLIEDQTGLARDQIQRAVSRLAERLPVGLLERKTVSGRRHLRYGAARST